VAVVRAEVTDGFCKEQGPPPFDFGVVGDERSSSM
jgi:hypothetical protein